MAPRLKPGIRQGVRDRDRAEAGRPARQEHRRLQVGVRVVDRGDVVDNRPVTEHRHVSPAGECLPQSPTGGEADKGRFEVLGDLLVAGVVTAVESDVPHLLRCLLDHLQQVAQHGHALVALVEDFQRAVDDRLFTVGGRLLPQNRQQRRHHRVATAVSVSQNLLALLLFACCPQPFGRLDRLAGIQHIQVPAAAAERDDLPTERLNQVDIVRLQVAQHQRQRTEPGTAGSHAADDRGLAKSRQAQHEHGRVADEVLLEPGDRVAADR